MRRSLLTAAAAVVVAVPFTASAQAFDFESTAFGSYASLTITNAGQTLTVTPAAGFVTISDFSIAAGLGTRSAVGTSGVGISVPFQPLTFAFARPVGSITFLFGDSGGEDDTPARIEAFDAASAPLGTFDYPYGAGVGTAGSAALTFGGAGASSFVLTSPSGNPHSIYWEVESSTLATSAVPEPATVALVGGGLLALAGVARRRARGHAARDHAA